MQTSLAESFRDTPEGIEAERILRSCVHCGFCLATCPTYQILGNELDSPRGRIYLIKQLLEGEKVSARTRTHLDRCLTCRNCETTCPSGVEYGKLLDIGRVLVEAQAPRSLRDSLQRALIGRLISDPALFAPMLKLGQKLRPFLPGPLRQRIPPRTIAEFTRPVAQHARRMLLLEGCAQPALAPGINTAAIQVLDRLGITLVSTFAAGCCGAVRYHLNDADGGVTQMRRNIDAWLPHLDAGAEAIVMTASGCGVMVKDYGWHLRRDSAYAAKAARVSAAAKDLSEVVAAESARLEALFLHTAPPGRVAFHPPCTLQHGQQITGVVESLLRQAGFELVRVVESHLCCGSAGTYSLLQPAIADALKARKLVHLQADSPALIATANIGCLTHLQSDAAVPVKHWIELLASQLEG